MCRHVLAGELVVEHESVALADFAEAFAAQARHPHRKLVLIPPDGGGEDSSIMAAAGSRLAAAGREPDTL
jgi:hypothetical protein